MTTPPTFSVGQTLTSAAMNSVGLWLVKSQTVGTGVSSVTVTGAFSADYDNYRIVWSGTTCSVGDFGVFMKIGSAAANYYGNMTYYKIGVGQGFLPTNNGASGYYCTIQGANADTNLVMDIQNPYNAVRTTSSGSGFGWLSQFTFSGLLADAGSHTSFNFTLGSGTMTGGTIRVYGYRN